MHLCTLCQREFTTKGSLHRHQQNHQRTREYACSVCNLSFLRQDLLTRHSRIHQNEHLESQAGRIRSRKACEPCRRARTKCNSSLPCERCETRNEECIYAEGSTNTRTSRDLGLLEASPPATAGSSLTTYAVGSEGYEDSTLRGGDPFGLDTTSLPTLPMNQTSFSPLATSWLWLHEDTFLQSAVSLDFFDVSGDQVEAQLHVVSDNGTAMDDQTLADDPECAEKLKQEIVDSVVGCASRWTKEQKAAAAQSPSFEADLKALCLDIATVFVLSDGERCVSAFVTLYEQNFWPLWPLVSRFQLDLHTFHPFLYLAMASIGAMYGGKNAASFGMTLHARLREELIEPFFDYDIADKDMLSLGQARSLTQAAALYFGHERAFSFAQHIGANLVAQARRTNLFSVSPQMNTEPSVSTRWVESWIRRENRKRLALAILRLEMYTSMLHSTRPLVSAEELDIELPCSHYVWHSHFDSTQSLAAAVKQELSIHKSQHLISDLIRIAFDSSESLPHLGTLDQELVFNSLQERVWTACSARDSLERLTGLDIYNSIMHFDHTENTLHDGFTSHSQRHKSLSLDSHLASRSPKMNSLKFTMSSLLNTLQKCHTSLASSPFSDSPSDRTSLLTCLLTFHLSHLQLFAPLSILHKTCHLHISSHSSYSASSTNNPNNSVNTSTTTDHSDHALSNVRVWTTTSSAYIARSHAAHIYHLLRSEADRPPATRASVNFLTTIGLYHSAVLLWLCRHAAEAARLQAQDRGVERDDAGPMQQTQAGIDDRDQDGPDIRAKSRSSWVLDTVVEPSTEAFVTLFHDINPAWAVRSSFCTAVQQLVGLSSPFERRRAL